MDDFNQAGLKAFGPTRAAAELEWSEILPRKSWSNMVFRQQPMAHFQISRKQGLYRKAWCAYRSQSGWLGAWEGCRRFETVEQAVEAAHEMLLDNKFGDSRCARGY